MTDFYDDDDDNDETEVERPKPKPRQEPPKPPPAIINIPAPEDPSAGRGSNGGSKGPVPPMPDYVEPKEMQSKNDREVADAFAQHPRMGKVVPIRPGTTPNAAPSRPATAPERGGGPGVAPPASRPSRGNVAASPEVVAAQRAAYEAAARARQAAQIEAQALNEAEALEEDLEPEPRRVPVRRRMSPFVLLGVSTAALVAAVAFSMWERSEIQRPPEEEEEGDDEEMTLEPIDIDSEPEETSEPDIIDGEIVEDEEVA